MTSSFCHSQTGISLLRAGLRMLLIVAIVFAAGIHAAEAGNKKKSHANRQANAGPVVQQKYSALVIDATSGKIIRQENADAIRHPASLTKMMTLYMTFAALERGQLTLNQRLFVSPQAASQSPSKLGLRPGDRLRVEDAILGLVTQSANDAAVVLAESQGGSEARFAQMMTSTAQKLGMTNTVFKNASGLPNKQQVTTARDMAKLALALLRHYPQYYQYFSTPAFEYAGEVHYNHNRLMARFEGMDGIKTGFINASGFNLVASAVRDGHRLVGVVFGGRTAALRDNQMEKLMTASFDAVREMDRAPQMASKETGVVVKEIAAAQTAAGQVALPNATAVPATVASAAAAAPSVMQRPQTAQSNVVDNSIKQQPVGEGDADLQPEPAVVTREQVNAMLAAQPADSWGIQIGAYNDRASAQRALAITADQNAELLGKANTRVIAVDAPSGTIYRARLIGLDSRSARQACARLQRQGRPCFTLPPAGAPQAWLASAE